MNEPEDINLMLMVDQLLYLQGSHNLKLVGVTKSRAAFLTTDKRFAEEKIELAMSVILPILEAQM